jgi:hypothetical protein
MDREGFEAQICFLMILVTLTEKIRLEMSPFTLDLYTEEYNSDRFLFLWKRKDDLITQKNNNL